MEGLPLVELHRTHFSSIQQAQIHKEIRFEIENVRGVQSEVKPIIERTHFNCQCLFLFVFKTRMKMERMGIKVDEVQHIRYSYCYLSSLL